MRRLALVAIVALLTTSGCASDDGHERHSASGGNHDSSMDHGGSVPGSAVDKSEATREVLVIASDDLRFDPTSIQVDAGEVITFVVRNDGETEHEFVLGDQDYQEMHESDMAEGDHHMSGMDNAVTIAPGESVELTWRFEEKGEVLYGCHEPGHYDGGMVGTVEVG